MASGGLSGELRAVAPLRVVFAELHTVTIRNTVSFHSAREQFDEHGNPRDPRCGQRRHGRPARPAGLVGVGRCGQPGRPDLTSPELREDVDVTTPADTYTHGHHASVLRSHRWRTAENSAGYLLPRLQAGQRLLDLGCGPGTITIDLAVG